MTQTPNDDHELGQDTDVNISEPSPDAAYHDHALDKKTARSSWFAVSIGAFVISGVLAGIIYLAYMKGIEYGQDHVPPLIAADDSLIKVPPETSEADNRFENGDLHIYDVISGNVADNTDAKASAEAGAENSTGETTMTPSGDMVLQDENENIANADSQIVEMEMMDETPLAEAQIEPMAESITEAEPLVLSENAETIIIESGEAQGDNFVTSLAGVYAVQISSVRSLEQAEITYGRLQQRFPVLLASREPMVQRADLGERGIFFRLAITGFATRPAANDFCDALKDGGQDCFVRKIN
ncbi:MAG: SPOR domain-containing protein [Alphaproteobacteria bacterium]|nr:SPOR domain-containing protein [Alphaproteobacteria bacterium]